jgi:hypothetical protein
MFFSFFASQSSPHLADECLVNQDCPLDKACISNECRDPCQRQSCGRRAECKVDYHVAKCVCAAGLQGNPFVECIEVGCRTDNDCAANERCNRGRQECVPLCQGQRCAQGARCEATNHKESCICDPPLQGDGYVYCQIRTFFATPLMSASTFKCTCSSFSNFCHRVRVPNR